MSDSGGFWNFLWARKQYWLYPVLTVAVIIVGLLLLANGKAIAPFLYRNF